MNKKQSSPLRPATATTAMMPPERSSPSPSPPRAHSNRSPLSARSSGDTCAVRGETVKRTSTSPPRPASARSSQMPSKRPSPSSNPRCGPPTTRQRPPNRQPANDTRKSPRKALCVERSFYWTKSAKSFKKVTEIKPRGQRKHKRPQNSLRKIFVFCTTRQTLCRRLLKAAGARKRGALVPMFLGQSTTLYFLRLKAKKNRDESLFVSRL
jgi:hypothetical protein